MRVIPMAGKDAELVSEKRRSRELELTTLAKRITDLLTEFRPRLLILDTAADVFGGDEINRKQVRFFVSMLRRIAMGFDLAVLLLSHPSVAGMQTGTGLSGSTAWNNSVRSRLYFTADKTDEDLRLLKNMKANYGRKGAETKLRWHEGAFILDDGKPSATSRVSSQPCRQSFLEDAFRHQWKRQAGVIFQEHRICADRHGGHAGTRGSEQEDAGGGDGEIVCGKQDSGR